MRHTGDIQALAAGTIAPVRHPAHLGRTKARHLKDTIDRRVGRDDEQHRWFLQNSPGSYPAGTAHTIQRHSLAYQRITGTPAAQCRIHRQELTIGHGRRFGSACAYNASLPMRTAAGISTPDTAAAAVSAVARRPLRA